MAAAIIAAVLFCGSLSVLRQEKTPVLSRLDREWGSWLRELPWVMRWLEIEQKDVSERCFATISLSCQKELI